VALNAEAPSRLLRLAGRERSKAQEVGQYRRSIGSDAIEMQFLW
jgi:hypothetical protein